MIHLEVFLISLVVSAGCASQEVNSDLALCDQLSESMSVCIDLMGLLDWVPAYRRDVLR